MAACGLGEGLAADDVPCLETQPCLGPDRQRARRTDSEPPIGARLAGRDIDNLRPPVQ
jgi:hypothetical protein